MQVCSAQRRHSPLVPTRTLLPPPRSCRALRVFDISRPGRECNEIITQDKRREGSIPGIISALAFSPSGDLLAAGSYAGVIGLFDGATLEQQLLLSGHKGGVTQVGGWVPAA